LGVIYGGGVRIEKKSKRDVNMPKEMTVILAKQEKKLVDIMRGLDYGNLHITVKDGLPVHVEEIKKSIKL